MDASELLDDEMLEGILPNGKSPRIFILKQGGERLVLPVTPFKYSLQNAQDNKSVDIIDTGERLLFGNGKLARLKFSSFFPRKKHQYPFVMNINVDAGECVSLIEKWRTSKEPVQVIITDSPVNLKMAIEEFEIEERDGTRDIYYRLSLTEYKEFLKASNEDTTIDDKTGLRDRADDKDGTFDPSKYLDPYEASKDVYGDFDSLPVFLEDNDLDGVSPRDYGGLVMW